MTRLQFNPIKWNPITNDAEEIRKKKFEENE